MEKHDRGGPRIRRTKTRRYEAAFAFEWPVFPVELTDDPERVRAGQDWSTLYSGDPDSLSPLFPWDDEHRKFFAGEYGSPPLEEGLYIVATDTKPVRVYEPLLEQPSPLDRALSLNSRKPEDIFGFVERFGFLGSTRRRGVPSGVKGEVVKLVGDDLWEIRDWHDEWVRLRSRPPERWRDVDRASLSEMTFALNAVLMEGVGPALRLDNASDEGLQIATGFTCGYLIHALYLELYLHMAEGREHHKCPGCANLFSPRRSNQKFCSESCNNAHRQRRFQKRRRLDAGSGRV